MSNWIPLKQSYRLYKRILCACLLLIFLSMLVNWRRFLRKKPVDTSLPYQKTLPGENTKKTIYESLTPQSPHHTSRKVAFHLNSSKDTVQPYMKILPRKNPEDSAESSIPRILHQTWKTPELAAAFKPWIKSCIEQNPDWEYWFWTDNEMRDLVSEKYKELLQMYDSYPQGIFRADAFRILAVHQYGGVYADLDFECLRPFQIAIGQQSCFFSTEPDAHAEILAKMKGPMVSNGLFGCVPNHPFFIFLIQNLKHHSSDGVLSATGPLFVKHLHKQFSSEKEQLTSLTEYDVPLLDSEIFQPTIDEIKVDKVKEICSTQGSAKVTERGKRVCETVLHKDFQNQPTPQAVTNHHWSHSWTGSQVDRWDIRGKNTLYFKITELNNVSFI